MRILIAPIALLAACSPMAGDEHAVSPAHPEDERSYATQVEAPTPDYAELMRAEHYDGEGYVRREATAAPPANARDIGRTWTGRLEAAHALLGAGYDGKGADGAVTSIDVGMTESEFARWAQENGWTVPRHIAWSFVPAMNLPTVSEAAKPGIRFWPASSARTGAQNEALLFGRVELRDGCFWATQGDGEADQLAFFHAEIGLDKDAEGFYVLKDRVGGQTLARLGEQRLYRARNHRRLARSLRRCARAGRRVARKPRTLCGQVPARARSRAASARRLTGTAYPCNASLTVSEGCRCQPILPKWKNAAKPHGWVAARSGSMRSMPRAS